MKNSKLKFIISIFIVVAASCNKPKTVVTNIVHPDGSVTRRIEVKNTENKFEASEMQVPFDSTWIIRDSIEITKEGDTIWVKRAEKLFAGIEEINLDYMTDSGTNKEIPRHAELRKKFKWFNTEYRFAEIVDKNMHYGYPVRDFLKQEELDWFYSPDNIREDKKNSTDSLRYRAFDDTVEKKLEKWLISNLVSEWEGEFTLLTGEKAKNEMTHESLKNREKEFVRIVELNLEHFDSLWSNGYLLREFIGEANALEYKVEADSAANIAIERLLVDFSDYSVRTIMPGKLTETNGLLEPSGAILWPVKSDYFMTEQYEMIAESKVPNIWAWIVSGLFLLFVLTGIYRKKRG